MRECSLQQTLNDGTQAAGVQCAARQLAWLLPLVPTKRNHTCEGYATACCKVCETVCEYALSWGTPTVNGTAHPHPHTKGPGISCSSMTTCSTCANECRTPANGTGRPNSSNMAPQPHGAPCARPPVVPPGAVGHAAGGCAHSSDGPPGGRDRARGGSAAHAGLQARLKSSCAVLIVSIRGSWLVAMSAPCLVSSCESSSMLLQTLVHAATWPLPYDPTPLLMWRDNRAQQNKLLGYFKSKQA